MSNVLMFPVILESSVIFAIHELTLFFIHSSCSLAAPMKPPKQQCLVHTQKPGSENSALAAVLSCGCTAAMHFVGDG